MKIKKIPQTHFSYDREGDPLRIVLHDTAGAGVWSSVDYLARLAALRHQQGKGFIGVGYFISRSGEILQWYEDDRWGYHTGRGRAFDSSSIGVELANSSHLCLLGETHSQSWRGKEAFEIYPEAQVLACAWLCATLCKKHEIEPIFADNLSPEIADLVPVTMRETIISHANVRTEKKWDLNPSFPRGNFKESLEGLL